MIPIPDPKTIISCVNVGLDIFNKISHDYIYVYNDCRKPRYIAIYFQKDSRWYARYWFSVQAASKACLLVERLSSCYIYLHSFDEDGKITGNGDFSLKINGVKRNFTKFNVGNGRANFTITIS